MNEPVTAQAQFFVTSEVSNIVFTLAVFGFYVFLTA